MLNEFGADAMRLYLITSPVVHGDNLAFNRLGVQEVIRSVFLPWYNAYRFLVQNALRHESETETSFSPAKVHPPLYPLVKKITELLFSEHCGSNP